MSATAPDRRALLGTVVRLDPLTPDDAPALFAALDDPRVWVSGYAGGPAGRPTDVAAMQSWVARLLTFTDQVPYAVRLVDGGTVVGTTSLGEVDVVNESAHLGWTAYAPAVWGTAVNPECKLLLLGHAFEDCGFGRVKIQTDSINERSQAAIAKLGATREGVLRRHLRRADGTFRDTVLFSVLREEWPGVRAGLLARVREHRV
ncbi:MAG: GNAT family protein [Actinomycetota bacterium]